MREGGQKMREKDGFSLIELVITIAIMGILVGLSAFSLNYISQADPQVKIVSEGDAVYLEMNVEKEMLSIPTEVIDTQKLGMVRLVEAPFDDPDGNPVVLDTDYLGNTREAGSAAGAFADLKEGFNRFRVWG